MYLPLLVDSLSFEFKLVRYSGRVLLLSRASLRQNRKDTQLFYNEREISHDFLKTLIDLSPEFDSKPVQLSLFP
jgi:hypothetical protein